LDLRGFRVGEGGIRWRIDGNCGLGVFLGRFHEVVAHQFAPALVAVSGNVFVFEAGVGLEYETTEISGNRSAFVGDAISRERTENGGEGMVHIRASVEAAGDGGDFVGNILSTWDLRRT
jgi:hypothetical protein